jgi:hypothetical protein
MPTELDRQSRRRWTLLPYLALLLPAAGCLQDVTHVSTLQPPSAAPRAISVPAESRIEEGESFSVSVAATPREGVPIGMSVGAGQYFRVHMAGLIPIVRIPTESPRVCTSYLCEDLAVGKKVGPLGAMYFKRPEYLGFHSFGPQFFVVPRGRSLDSLTHNVYEAPVISLTGGSHDGVTDQVEIGSTAYFDIYTQSVVSGIARAPQTGELRILRRDVGELTTSGAQSVSVQPFTPLLLGTGVSSSAGGTRFVARTSGTPHRVRWTFFEGDTLERSHQNIQRVVWVDACADQMACDYVPARSGRMEVQLRITEITTPQYATSDVVRAGATAPALKLACTSVLGENRVTRGDTITCTASKDPVDVSGELKISGWTFEGADRKDGENTSPRWVGVIAKGGVVRVSGTLDGSAVVADTRITLRAREWPVYELTHMPDTLIVLLPGMSGYPRVGENLGTFALRLLPEESVSSAVDSIAAGPNAGMLFLRNLPSLDGVGADITLHPALYPPSAGMEWADPEYEHWQRDQNRRGSGTCGASAIPVVRREAERHEGVTLAANSHLGVANRGFRELQPQKDFEKLILENQTRAEAVGEIHALWEAFRDTRLHPRQVAFDANDYPRVYGPEALGCVLDFNPRDN